MTRITKITKKQEEKMKKAAKDFDKIQTEIHPFIKKRTIIQTTTGDKWKTEAVGNKKDKTSVNSGTYSLNTERTST